MDDFKLLLFFGSLGDGTIYQPQECNDCRYEFRQILPHKDSVLARQKLLQPYIDGRTCIVKRSINNIHAKNDYFCFYTKTHRAISEVHSDIYGAKKYLPENYMKHINWLGLALWYMDDGSLAIQRNGKKVSATFSTDCFTHRDCELAQFYVNKNLGVFLHIHKAKINKEGQQTYRLRISKSTFDVFMSGLSPFICDSFYYKLSVREAPNKYVRMKSRSDLISNNEIKAEMS